MSFIKRWFGFGNDEEEEEPVDERREMYKEEHEKGNESYLAPRESIEKDDHPADFHVPHELNAMIERNDYYIGQVQKLGWTLRDIKGIGKKTAEKFANSGIHNPTQLLYAENMEESFPDVASYISRFVEQLKKQLDDQGGDN